uniref:Candidate secreted effector n=1 Tax=Meloidogyne incognita TaxID=6306 RepID=A0A914L427_MELIC
MLENKAFSWIYETSSLTTNLRNDELLLRNEGNNTYPVRCQCNPRYENIDRIRVFWPYVRLIHTFTSNKI